MPGEVTRHATPSSAPFPIGSCSVSPSDPAARAARGAVVPAQHLGPAGAERPRRREARAAQPEDQHPVTGEIADRDHGRISCIVVIDLYLSRQTPPDNTPVHPHGKDQRQGDEGDPGVRRRVPEVEPAIVPQHPDQRRRDRDHEDRAQRADPPAGWPSGTRCRRSEERGREAPPAASGRASWPRPSERSSMRSDCRWPPAARRRSPSAVEIPSRPPGGRARSPSAASASPARSARGSAR